MSKATIDFEKKEITLTIPYSSAQDMAMAIEVAQDACDKHMDSMKDNPNDVQVSDTIE